MHSFGKPEGEDGLQCYLGLEDAAYDIERRMSIMIDAVDAAYDRSDDDPDVLKIFLAPEFFFRWKVSLSSSSREFLCSQKSVSQSVSLSDSVLYYTHNIIESRCTLFLKLHCLKTGVRVVDIISVYDENPILNILLSPFLPFVRECVCM